MSLEITPELERLNVQFRQVRSGPSSAPPEISSPDPASAAPTPTEPATPVGVDSATQERFDMAVAACREVSAANYFHNRKYKLVEKLAPAYTIYQLVKLNPALVEQLFQIDLLQERTRKLSRNKLALACVYSVLQPGNEDDFKACSDYTAYLPEAEAQDTLADDFVQWAKPQRLKACLKAVRQRKHAEKMGDQDQPSGGTVDLRLTITRNVKGVQGRMDGRAISLTEATLDAIIKLIEATTSPYGAAAEAGGTNV